MNDNDQPVLPPKTCSIEKLITNPTDIEKVLNGGKTATRRNGRYADVGEIMELNGRNFVIKQVYQQTLGELKDTNAEQEGYENVEAYKQAILAMHPGMPWAPQMKVWVHEFAPVKDTAE